MGDEFSCNLPNCNGNTKSHKGLKGLRNHVKSVHKSFAYLCEHEQCWEVVPYSSSKAHQHRNNYRREGGAWVSVQEAAEGQAAQPEEEEEEEEVAEAEAVAEAEDEPLEWEGKKYVWNVETNTWEEVEEAQEEEEAQAQAEAEEEAEGEPLELEGNVWRWNVETAAWEDVGGDGEEDEEEEEEEEEEEDDDDDDDD